MKKLPSSKAPSCAVDKYIGTDFDHVVTVSKEMESVKEVAEVTEHIVVTGSNIEAIKTVATNIGDVNNVSDNMEYVKDVAAGIEGLPVVSYIGSEPPAQPVEGATWYCTTDGRTYVWYKDTDSYQWVESSPQSIAKEDVRTPIVARAALERALLLDGYTLVTGSFELGATLTKATDVILQEVTGKVYSWGGSFPATVPTGSTPDSTGGIGSNTWTLRSVPEVLKRIEAEEADTQDWKGFTDELLSQGGITDNGQPDKLGASQRVDAISKICGRQFANVDEMLSFNKLEVGARYSTGGTTWEYLGGGGVLANFNPLNYLHLKDFGVVGSEVVDDINEQATIQYCIDYAYSKGIRYIKGDGLTVGITKIILKSVILDMEGGHLYRKTGGSLLTMRPMITAGEFGQTTYDNSGLLNCHVTGTGAEEGVNDQGHAIGMYSCDNFLIKNVSTDNTNGDGIATRAANGQINNVKIGSFGRNGISPTSGIIYYNIVDINGPVLAGANPGQYFDSEINDNTEVSEHYIDGMTSNGMTFVDLKATEGQKFAIKVSMKNCRLGGAYRTLRFQSNQPSVDADIFVDGSNIIEVAATADNTGVEITNVSGITMGPLTVRNNGATTSRLIKIIGEVKQLTLQKPYLTGTFSIDCVGTGTLSDSNLSFTAAPRMYLQGSNNIITADSYARIDLNLATTIDNKFFINGAYAIVDINLSGGARSEDQYFPKNLADAATRIVPQGDIVYTKSQFQSSGAVQNMNVYIPIAGVYKLIVKTGSSSSSYAYKEFLVHFNPVSGALTLMQTLHSFIVGTCTIQDPVGNVGYISVETSPQFSSNCSVTVIG